MNTPASSSDRHEDPLTHEPDAHPVATGLGAAGLGAAAAVVGTVVAGPLGGLVGAVVGAVAGGLGGKSVSEAEEAGAAPAEETVPWHEVIPSGLPSYEEVALRAYGLYEHEGRPQGQDLRHWLAAEESLRAEGAVIPSHTADHKA